MALIRCSDCGREISDTTDYCIHCGCPLGKAIFNTTDTFIGLAGRYVISDASGAVIAKLKSGSSCELKVYADTRFYVYCNTAFSRKKVEMIAYANKINKFEIGVTSFSMKTYVDKLN